MIHGSAINRPFNTTQTLQSIGAGQSRTILIEWEPIGGHVLGRPERRRVPGEFWPRLSCAHVEQDEASPVFFLSACHFWVGDGRLVSTMYAMPHSDALTYGCTSKRQSFV